MDKELLKKPEIQYINYLGVRINNIDYAGIWEKNRKTLKENRNEYICLTNVGNVIWATDDKDFKQAINNSILSIADGTPLCMVWEVGWLYKY